MLSLKFFVFKIFILVLTVEFNSSVAPVDKKLEKLLNSFNLPNQGKCGIAAVKQYATNERIIYGTNAIQKSWPWVVSLSFSDKEKSAFSPGCGGAIIYNKYILTAAHCVLGQPPNTVKVIAGVTDTSKATEAETYAVSKIYYNSNFNLKLMGAGNDIAILKLARPIKYSATASPVCLPGSRDSSKVINKTVVAVGW